MLPTVLRLQRRPQFLKVAGTRQKWVAPGLILQIRRRPQDEQNETEAVPEGVIRLGFTVSKKVGNAVQRNRARRRLRAAAGEVFAQHAALGCDFVVIGRAATLKRSYDSLIKDMQASLKGLKAWREA
ncbi:MAG: ribonuclease P protein component [Rhodospirillales bacterium]|jgi:ribonuclease P protein component|nr:ribonuclease P protein component [Rhodospirillales bacterium]MBT4039266.1 ribonuclease P protein component [Rhodospirillales bacterium]MBT4626906.1 ribonuclease P protein component [Rhodospirillales bacterium]MBT5352502.1 ribonuclease P protein component [Rhodospirillales bacterium]MBT5519482.1 ribonuclease P protein component [Rhodospirillales bacterium]